MRICDYYPDVSKITNGSFTLSAWIKYEQTAQDQSVARITPLFVGSMLNLEQKVG